MKEVDLSLIGCDDGKGGRGLDLKMYLEHGAQYEMRDTR